VVLFFIYIQYKLNCLAGRLLLQHPEKAVF
jgi:hypothetical protein